MKFFGLDTTRKSAKIFIYNDEKINKTIIQTIDENIKHSEGLFLYIEKVLFEANMKIYDFDYLSCVVGPGSFTGIRVGMSVIKAFNKVINKKIIPINMFEILSEKIKNGIILLNSTNSTCYYAKIKNNEIQNCGLIDKKQIREMFPSDNLYMLKEEQKLLNIEYNINEIGDDFSELYAKSILKKINSDNSNFVFEPFYLQSSQAERNLKDECENSKSKI